MTASGRSGRALDWLYFFVADLQTGFGPFIVVYLTTMAWTDADIGFALSLGTMAAVIGQVPAGALVDAALDKRRLARTALLAIALSAVLLAAFPEPLPVYLSRLLHGFASCILNPSIAAISLALVGRRGLGERLGRNARYASLGGALTAGAMGWIGSTYSPAAVFWLTALLALPSLLCLHLIDPDDLRSGPLPKAKAADQNATWTPATGQSGERWQDLLGHRGILAFAICAALFTMSNAAMLPLVSSAITRRSGDEATAIIAACIVLPQLVVVAISPWVGQIAEVYGRKLVLVLGLGVLALRGLLLAEAEDPFLVILIQALDGISSAALAILLPLLAADFTRGTNRFNLCLGFFNLAVSVGGIVSTTLGGLVSAWAGQHTAMWMLAGIGALSVLVAWVALPETRLEDKTS